MLHFHHLVWGGSYIRYDPKILKYVDLHVKERRGEIASSDDMDCETLTNCTIRLVPKLNQQNFCFTWFLLVNISSSHDIACFAYILIIFCKQSACCINLKYIMQVHFPCHRVLRTIISHQSIAHRSPFTW